MERDFFDEAKTFKAVCDEKRLRILALLLDGEKCVCALNEEMDLPQSTLSYHMKILCESGVVEGRQEGKWTHYSISVQGIGGAAETLKRYVPKGVIQLGDEGCCASL